MVLSTSIPMVRRKEVPILIKHLLPKLLEWRDLILGPQTGQANLKFISRPTRDGIIYIPIILSMYNEGIV